MASAIATAGAASVARHPYGSKLARCRSRSLRSAGLLLGLIFFGASDARQLSAPQAATAGATATVRPAENRVWMVVGTRRFAVTLSDNASGRAFAELLPLKLNMEDLNANEKKVQLPKSLPGKSTTPGTIHNGDLMLYRADILVVFYQTFASPYPYSRIGRVDNPTGLAQALGRDAVVLEFLRASPEGLAD